MLFIYSVLVWAVTGGLIFGARKILGRRPVVECDRTWSFVLSVVFVLVSAEVIYALAWIWSRPCLPKDLASAVYGHLSILDWGNIGLLTLAFATLEEAVFRKLLLGALCRFVPWQVALVVAAALFAAAHLPQGVYEATVLFASGILLGGIYLRTGTIVIPAILHFVMNLKLIGFSVLFKAGNPIREVISPSNSVLRELATCYNHSVSESTVRSMSQLVAWGVLGLIVTGLLWRGSRSGDNGAALKAPK